MTAARPAFTTPLFGATSYITPADYKSAPTGINTSNLIVGGNQAANDAALADVIRRASGWADEIPAGITATSAANTLDSYTFRQVSTSVWRLVSHELGVPV